MTNPLHRLQLSLPWYLNFASAFGLVVTLLRKDMAIFRSVPMLGPLFGTAYAEVVAPQTINLQHYINCGVVTAVCLLVIRLLHSICCQGFKRQYYALHVIVNSIVTYLTFNGAVRAFLNPATSTVPKNNSNNSHLYLCWIFAIHVYHPIFFKTGVMDWIHHVPVYILNFLMFGCMSADIFDLQGIIMTGIPGGLDYLFLVMEAEKAMKRSTYKGISASINNWFRGPCGIVSGYSCLLGLYLQWDNVGTEALSRYQAGVFFFLGVHAVYNPPFFGRQAIEANIVDTINRYKMVGLPGRAGIKLTDVRSKSGTDPVSLSDLAQQVEQRQKDGKIE